MGASQRRRIAVAVSLAVVCSAGGAAYVWKQAETNDDDAADDELVVDASVDVRAAGKKKPGKKDPRAGKPRGGKARRGGGRAGGGGTRGGGTRGGGGPSPGVGTDDDTDEAPEPVDDRPPFTGRGPAGPTYEAALASNRQEVVIGSRSVPDLSDAQLAAPMRNGAFVGACGAPEKMRVTVKVAIRMGRPVGVSVSTNPFDPDVAGCIDRYVRTFSWPSHAKMDSFTTTY